MTDTPTESLAERIMRLYGQPEYIRETAALFAREHDAKLQAAEQENARLRSTLRAEVASRKVTDTQGPELPNPSPIKSIDEVAAYLRENDYNTCVIAHNGGVCYRRDNIYDALEAAEQAREVADRQRDDYMDGIANCLSAVGIDMSDLDKAEAECCRIGQKPSDVVRARYETAREREGRLRETLEDVLPRWENLLNETDYNEAEASDRAALEAARQLITPTPKAEPARCIKETNPGATPFDCFRCEGGPCKQPAEAGDAAKPEGSYYDREIKAAAQGRADADRMAKGEPCIPADTPPAKPGGYSPPCEAPEGYEWAGEFRCSPGG